ncbi:MAG TPA: hypothetical protein VG675_07705 [Bryobacteraceae bacterium]|nr:hypothetical protein [Bryobacteraceae bacterium]
MPDNDHYELYYSNKLWSLLPAVYRSADSATLDQAGPLRELVNRIGAQAAILRRSIDRLWEDQSIETCDDWVIPYIAQLLATNLVSSLDARGQRIDVARTIYYRRRKGTVGILEEIAGDITGWDARVVEMFRRLGRTRHGLDPAIGPLTGVAFPDPLQSAEGLIGTRTHTGIGGWADLRNRYGASKAHSAFDEFFHEVDFRFGRGQVGWYNIPRLGVFLWRLESLGMDQCTPVPVTGCPGHFTFDPSGREIPLFAASSRREDHQFGDQWTSPDEWQLGTPISQELLEAQIADLYPRSLGVYRKSAAGYDLIDEASLKLFPALGRFRFTGAGPLFGAYHYGFSSRIGAGPFDRRVLGVTPDPLPAPEVQISGGGALNAQSNGTTTILDSLTYTSAAPLAGVSNAAIRAENLHRPLLRLAAGAAWEITGSSDAMLVLDGVWVSGGDMVLSGDFDSVTIRTSTLDPGTEGTPPAVFATAVDGRTLSGTTLWIEARVGTLTIDRCILGQLRTRNFGLVEKLQINDSIVQGLRSSDFSNFQPQHVKDPLRLAKRLRDAPDGVSKFIQSGLSAALRSELAAFDGASPPSAGLLSDIVSALNALIAGPSIFDPVRFAGVPLSASTLALLASNPTGPDLIRLNRLLLEEAYPLPLADAAIALTDGDTHLQRVTVLGRSWFHHISASETILDDLAMAEDPQSGCIRFSAWSTGSILPRKYESVEIAPQGPLFTTRVFGQPGYGQLLQSADNAVLQPAGAVILTGAQNGSEMGAFCSEKNAIKERSLLIKYEEFMPLGLSPVIIYVT